MNKLAKVAITYSSMAISVAMINTWPGGWPIEADADAEADAVREP